jgi:hypothetical protein
LKKIFGGWNTLYVFIPTFLSSRWVLYLFFGCGIPIVMTLILVILDNLKSVDPLPDVGTDQCFLSNAGHFSRLLKIAQANVGPSPSN